MARAHSIARRPVRRWGLIAGSILLASTTAGTRVAGAQYPSGPQVTKNGTAVLLQDYASLPLSSRTTGSYPPPINFADQLGRVNFLRSEPPAAPQSSSRFFVNDMNRHLYILDRTTRTFTPYLNFEEIFPKFDNHSGYAGGLVTFAFDPDYAVNGRFYTVHTEDPAESGSAIPINTSLPGLDLSGGYPLTAVVNPPVGAVVRQAVLVEWTDTNRGNSTFEGTAREILRVGFTSDIHPMGDLLFNPLTQPGDADHGNLYIAVGDGGAGERADAGHAIPQRLDALQGKVLRITPDLTRRPGDELSANGRYRIPTTGPVPNPFATLGFSGLRKEIFAYGFRNPHRMSWDREANTVIVNDIGLHAWEEINILGAGANYGYAAREGSELLLVGGANNGKTGSQTSPPTPFPDPDSLAVTGIAEPVTPVYPVAAYSHRDGDAIGSGFVYRGLLMPTLRGTYLFGDISTGRLFYADLSAMIGAHDGDRGSLAAIHELQVVFDTADDDPDRGSVSRRLFDIVADEYARKGGNAPGSAALPGASSRHITNGNDPDGVPYGGGRADIRLALGGDDEIYVLSKSDGMIRRLVAVGAPPPPPPELTIRVTSGGDDAAEAVSGKVTLTGRTLRLATQQTVGLRFSGVSIPPGATIQRAWVQFKATKRELYPTALTLQGQAVNQAPVFTTSARNISSRARTAATVSWSPETWTLVGEAGPRQRTPDLAAIIQEIVSRPGWGSGNTLVLLVAGTGSRTAQAFEGSAAGAAILHVEYVTSP